MKNLFGYFDSIYYDNLIIRTSIRRFLTFLRLNHKLLLLFLQLHLHLLVISYLLLVLLLLVGLACSCWGWLLRSWWFSFGWLSFLTVIKWVNYCVVFSYRMTHSSRACIMWTLFISTYDQVIILCLRWAKWLWMIRILLLHLLFTFKTGLFAATLVYLWRLVFILFWILIIVIYNLALNMTLIIQLLLLLFLKRIYTC